MTTGLNRRNAPYVSVGILVLIAVWVTCFWLNSGEREKQSEVFKQRAEAMVQEIAVHSAQTFDYADTYIRFAREEFGEAGLEHVEYLLEFIPLDQKFVSHITIIDQTGTPLLLSGRTPKPGVTAKDRQYFKFQQQRNDDVTYLSLPKRGRNSGKELIRLVRRLTNHEGEFDGVIFAAIHVPQFRHLFDVHQLSPNSEALLIGMDKKVRIHSFAKIPKKIGDYENSALWQEIQKSPVGFFAEVNPIDGQARVYYYQVLDRFSQVVVVGAATADVAASVQDYENNAFLIAVLISVVVIVLLILMLRELRISEFLKKAEQRLQIEVHDQTETLREEIKERRTIQRALEQSEARMTGFAGASSDWYWEMDDKLRFSYFSERFEEISGVAPLDLLGKTRQESGVPDVEPDQWEKQLADLAAHRAFRNFDHPRTRDDGSVVHLSISGQPYFDDAGKFMGFRGTGTDVTKQWEGERAVQQSKQQLEQRVEERTTELRELNNKLHEEEGKLREILENSPVGVAIVADTDDGVVMAGERLFVNDALVKMFGAEDKDAFLATQIPESWIDLEDLRNMQKMMTEKQEIRNFEVERYRLDGSIWWVSVSSRRIVFGGRTCSINWHFDITEQKRSEEELRRAQTMQAIGQLTGGVAHDFNNLLAVIMGNAELLADSLPDDNPMSKAILRASSQGAELTQRLLAFSRSQQLQPRIIDLTELVEGISEMLNRTLGETIMIETTAETELCAAFADPGQVERALLNLAINARDSMPDGGALTIDCKNTRLSAEEAAANNELRAGDYVVLSVSDTGNGMTADVAKHAFEPFFTTKEVGEGSGLGLSMVYGFAKQSGGTATIYSEIGIGTIVRLYLPQARATAIAQAPSQDETIPRGKGEKILVVEDDPGVRALTILMLEGLNYSVIEATDATHARAILTAGTIPDLVLSDVILPGGISGPEFVETARADWPALKFIFMSGYSTEAIRRTDFLSSGGLLLNKPFQRQALAEAVRSQLDRD